MSWGTIASGSGDPCAGVSIYGCTNPAADNYNAVANTDDGSCVITGCGDPSANNYDPNVTQSGIGMCDYTTYCYQCGGPNNNSPVGMSFTTNDNQCPAGWGPTVPTCSTPGCTNAAATNYNPNANTDDGSCIIPPAMTNITCYTDCPNPQTVVLDVPVGTTCDNADYSESLFNEMPPCAPPPNGNGNNMAMANANYQSEVPGETNAGNVNIQVGQGLETPAQNYAMGFDGSNQAFGKWQRRLSQRILINDTDWNPLVD